MLVPVVNRALLDYTVNFLASSEVDEIYIVCRSFAEQIEDHIEAIKGELFGKARIEILSFREARTVGDCLREVRL